MYKKKNRNKEDLSIIGKIVVGFLLVLLVVFAISFLMAIYFFASAGLFTVLNITYPSLTALAGFIMLLFGVSLLFEPVFKGLYYLVAAYIGRWRTFLYLLFDSIAGFLAIFTVDEVMTSITIPFSKEILIAVFFALVEYAFEDKMKGRK